MLSKVIWRWRGGRHALWLLMTPLFCGGLGSVAWGSAPTDAGALSAMAPPVLPLPTFQEPPLAKPGKGELERLEAVLAQLSSTDHSHRLEARRRVGEVNVSWLPAILARFERLADSSNKLALKALLEKVRERTRADLRAALEREGKDTPVVTPDYLDMLTSYQDRSAVELRPLTEVVALSRMLEQIGTLAAARGVVNVYVRFGEFLRVDTQLALARMQDRAIAALIETSAHPVPRIAAWARRQLTDLGKAEPSEAMQVTDATLRGDILRAYGKTQNIETARLLISYAASERALVRLASRQAVALLGQAALWPLRDAYEKTVGERAPLEWAWDRVARELFAQFDRQRLADIYAVFNRGRAAEQRGELAAASAAFDQVLAWDPSFARAELMAPVYLAYAESRADAEPEAAELAARRAERLAERGPLHERAQSLRYTLEAEALLARGMLDPILLRRARELDPTNERARALQRRLHESSTSPLAQWRRYLVALVISALGGAGIAFMVLRRRQLAREA